jgi:hypothetical protein
VKRHESEVFYIRHRGQKCCSALPRVQYRLEVVLPCFEMECIREFSLFCTKYLLMVELLLILISFLVLQLSLASFLLVTFCIYNKQFHLFNDYFSVTTFWLPLRLLMFPFRNWKHSLSIHCHRVPRIVSGRGIFVVLMISSINMVAFSR